jgi:hypothetical protein
MRLATTANIAIAAPGGNIQMNSLSFVSKSVPAPKFDHSHEICNLPGYVVLLFWLHV